MAKKEQAPADWYCLSRLQHDGATFEAGDAVPIDAERGEALLVLGVLSRVAPVLDQVEPAE